MSGERPPSAKDSDTSRAAADSMEESAATLRGKILDLIRKAEPHGLTTDEIEVITGLPHQTASPRVWELHRRALIGDTGQRRKTRSGRLAAVYRPISNEELMEITRRHIKKSEQLVQENKELAKKLSADEELLAALGIKKGDPQ